MPAAKDIRATRKHRIIKAREKQLQLNLLAKDGGSPYINARLSRFPCESDASWSGSTKSLKESAWSADWYSSGDNTGKGRKGRAYMINYAGRIVAKINQYVFGQSVKRDGINPAFAEDASRTGLTITDLMEEVSSYYTAGQWCWLSVDRGGLPIDPETGDPRQRSVAEREAAGDRVWWNIWLPVEVVDWRFGSDGKLLWLITEREVYDNESLTEEAKAQTVRTIYQRGEGVRLYLNKEKPDEIDREEPFTWSAPMVPFIPVGLPTMKPWWFDDVERVQSSILNLESAHNENLIQTVFPQLVLPHGIIEDVMRVAELTGVEGYEAALEMVRGLNYPILEPSDCKDITRYLMPDSQDLNAIPEEITRRRRELMDIVGLAMQKQEGKQAQSAESKAWDNLDPSNTLKKRAVMLESVEKKAVEMSRALDTSFEEYAPEYPRQFDIADPESDMQAILDLSNVDLPDVARREVMRAAVKVLSSMVAIPQERLDEIEEAIESGELTSLQAVAGQ